MSNYNDTEFYRNWFCFLAFLSLVLLCYACFSPGANNTQGTVVNNGPQKYRFLQKCEEGFTVEYISTKRKSMNEVCGVTQ